MPELRAALRGITPPLVTPFSGGEIDLSRFESVIEHVLDGGVDAVFVSGTTGEAASLTRSERRDLLARALETTSSEVPVLVGGTGTSVPETRSWLEEAADIGADGVFLTAPFFHTPNDPAGYRRFFDPIVKDSPIPIVLYNIPGFVGAEIPPDVVEAVAAHEAVVGLKDSGGDLGYGMELVDRTPSSVLVLQGIDELLLPSLRIGFDGGVNAGANVFPRAYATVVADPHDEAASEAHRTRLRPLFSMCETHGFASGIKAAMGARGLLEQPEVRPPLVAVEPDAVPASIAQLD